jgi:hypothetical protein
MDSSKQPEFTGEQRSGGVSAVAHRTTTVRRGLPPVLHHPWLAPPIKSMFAPRVVIAEWSNAFTLLQPDVVVYPSGLCALPEEPG